MKKTSFLAYICFFLMLLCSCSKDWLDVKSSKSLAVPASVKDFQAMLDNFPVVNQNSTMMYMEVAADGHFYTEDIWDSFEGTILQNVYTWTDDVEYTSSSDWDSPYAAILLMNIILDQSKKLNIEDTAVSHVRAQALFNRARLYFDLAQEFSPPYSPVTNKSDWGLPLRMNTDILQPSRRSTVHETYQQILSDLLIAKDQLPITASLITRASKPAALALLARVYLVMGDYKNSLKYSNECLGIKSELLDYNTISPGASFIGTNKEILFASAMFPDDPLTSYYLIDSSLYNSYSANDLRKEVFFQNSTAGIQFKGTYGLSQNRVFCGLVLDEVYLIRAESYARTGNITLAMKDLNDLLRTRWRQIAGLTTYVNQTAIDEVDALQKILLERRKQLILRNIRWSDLRRLNMDTRFATTISRTIGGSTYTLEPQSYRYTFPIPNDIIEASGMPQNNGWDQ